MEPHVFQRDENVYIVAPVSAFEPGAQEIEQFAFAAELKQTAPNENILWLRGHYVEADNPNRNGQMWTAGELALKSLTPRLMPVTVMHDPRTAVGLIADAKLQTPDADQVPRARLDTSLAVWAHRFPDVAEECQHNYDQGTLMQSMECLPQYFECAACGHTVPNVPGIRESALCEHLAGKSDGGEVAARILGNVVFTGTGLIFGSRGSRGAYDEAHLDVFQDQVAEFHARSHDTTRRKPKPRSKSEMDPIEISREEYAELQKRVPREDLTAAEERAEKAETERDAAVKAQEAAEVKAKEATDAQEAAETKLSEVEEAANADKLSKERFDKLGAGFTAKLTDSIKDRLAEQAKTMSEDEWTSRLDELAELTGVKPDEAAPENAEEDPEFTPEEIASAALGNESGTKQPSEATRGSVFGGLFKANKR